MLRQHTNSNGVASSSSSFVHIVVGTSCLIQYLLMYCAGEMRDTVEVLWEIFGAVRGVSGGTELVEACFGQHVIEHVLCGSCGQKATHITEYTELIFTASTTALQRHVRVGPAFIPDFASPWPLGTNLWSHMPCPTYSIM